MFFTNTDPYADGEYDEIDALNASVIFINEVATNILYNLGYMYQDVANFLKLPDT